MAESEGSHLRLEQWACGVMRVVLSFDIEVWCGGWDQLDLKFPAAFDRYIYGRSAAGDYALPKTLEILQKNRLKGVFFVEPLFAARFGMKYLCAIVEMIKAAGQEIQLHIHPEWSDELRPLPFPGARVKRQHLCYYDLQEQTRLIAMGRRLLEEAGSQRPTAFRAGSYAADANTYRALAANDMHLDSSLNNCFQISGQDIPRDKNSNAAIRIGSVQSVPVSLYRDGLGRLRPAQISAGSFAELRDALQSAQALGQQDFVLVSHNFEMLKPASALPDWVVVNRFERLCEFLAANSDRFEVGSFQAKTQAEDPAPALPRTSGIATTHRYIEQLRRRF